MKIGFSTLAMVGFMAVGLNNPLQAQEDPCGEATPDTTCAYWDVDYTPGEGVTGCHTGGKFVCDKNGGPIQQ